MTFAFTSLPSLLRFLVVVGQLQLIELTKEEMLARDLMVYKWCQEKGLPQTWLMAGGYGKEAPKIYAQFILKILHLMR